MPYFDHFKFNNGVLTDVKIQKDTEMYWDICMAGYENFCLAIKTTNPVSLCVTKTVMEKRMYLQLKAE